MNCNKMTVEMLVERYVQLPITLAAYQLKGLFKRMYVSPLYWYNYHHIIYSPRYMLLARDKYWGLFLDKWQNFALFWRDFHKFHRSP